MPPFESIQSHDPLSQKVLTTFSPRFEQEGKFSPRLLIKKIPPGRMDEMTSLFTSGILITTAALLSSCCASYGNAVRVHNLSGKPVYKQINRSQEEKISRLGHDSFYVPHEFRVGPYFVEPVGPDAAPLPTGRKAEFTIQSQTGDVYVYSGFDFENYSGPTYKRWYDPTWTCVEKRHRAVLRPDMSLKFGHQIIVPTKNEPETDPE